jgi:hypothetical protein
MNPCSPARTGKITLGVAYGQRDAQASSKDVDPFASPEPKVETTPQLRDMGTFLCFLPLPNLTSFNRLWRSTSERLRARASAILRPVSRSKAARTWARRRAFDFAW